jgi:hypothetical protein
LRAPQAVGAGRSPGHHISAEERTMTTRTANTPRALTIKNKVGLSLATLLGLSDLIGPFVPFPGAQDAPGPPTAVQVAGAVLGLITLAAVVHTWRTGNRVSARIIAGTRILSLLGALPAFFVPGVPAGVVAVVAAGALLTILSVLLVLSRREAAPAPAPAAAAR